MPTHQFICHQSGAKKGLLKQSHFAIMINYKKVSWQRPTLPGSRPPSTIGADSLNDRVRDVAGCTTVAPVTKRVLLYQTSRQGRRSLAKLDFNMYEESLDQRSTPALEGVDFNPKQDCQHNTSCNLG